MDKRTILAVMISLGIWVGWQKIYMEPYQKAAAEQQRVQEEARKKSLAEQPVVAAPKAVTGDQVKSAAPKAMQVESSQISVGTSRVTFSSANEFIQDWTLASYQNSMGNKEDLVSLEKISGLKGQLVVRFSEDGMNQPLGSQLLRGEGRQGSLMTFSGATVRREFQAGDSPYSGQVNIKIDFTKAAPKFVFLDLLGSTQRPNDKEGSIFGEAPDKVHITWRDSKSRESHIGANLKEQKESLEGVKWIGVDTKYFAFAVIPGKDLRESAGVQIKKDFFAGNPVVRGSLVVPTNGATSLSIPLTVYFGPKELGLLERTDPVLRDAIDFGWTSFLAIPLLKALQILFSFVGNYGIAIILLTLGVKIVLYPLTYKSMKAMVKMAKLQPELNALREKFKDDQQKLNQEMMGFMKRHGYNPMGGCLPMLLQMPIFFALYRVFFNSIELYQAPFFWWIKDLSASDPWFVTPVLVTGLMFLQQKLSPSTATDPTQQKMLQLMPVMFGVFMLMLPAGLNIYMLVNSMVSIGQQYYLNQKFGIAPRRKGAPAQA